MYFLCYEIQQSPHLNLKKLIYNLIIALALSQGNTNNKDYYWEAFFVETMRIGNVGLVWRNEVHIDNRQLQNNYGLGRSNNDAIAITEKK